MITRTIYSNSERSEQCLATECLFNLFLDCSWRFLLSNKLEQLELKLEKNWDLKTCKRSQTIFLTVFVNESVFMIIDLFKPTENLALTDF